LFILFSTYFTSGIVSVCDTQRPNARIM